MIDFLIHIPINVRRYFVDYIKRNLPELEKEVGDSISLNTPGHDHSKSWLLEGINEKKIPDIILSHGSDFSVLEDRRSSGLFSETAGSYEDKNPIRRELDNFKDSDNIFYPMFVVPLVMFYNRKLINKDELKNSWTDLLNGKRKVIFPDKHTPISKAVMAYLKKNYLNEYNTFKENLTFGNSPVEVIQAVATEKYDMGISNVSFSTMAKGKNIEINWPVEGVITLPQVLVWKKNADPKLMKIADLLTGDEIQQYLGQQAFLPVCEKAPVDAMPSDYGWKNTWDGWEAFIKGIQDIETEERGE